MRAMVLGVVLACGVAGSAAAQSGPALTTEIAVGGVPLTVELAADPATTALGLSYRDGLAPGTGMLFVFPGPGERAFWMKGMQFCLDIVWIESGVIQGAAESVCPMPAGTADADLPSYQSPVPVSTVLEVPAGWLAAYGLGAGTPVAGLPLVAGQ